MRDAPIPPTDPARRLSRERAAIDAAIARVLAGGRYILGPEVDRLRARVRGISWRSPRHRRRERHRCAGAGAAAPASASAIMSRRCRTRRSRPWRRSSWRARGRCSSISIPRPSPSIRAALARALAASPGRIAAVIPVHLYGQPADLDGLLPLARRHGARVIEDCAPGAWRAASSASGLRGALAISAAFSFYPTKNLGALGDGGMVVTERCWARRARAGAARIWLARALCQRRRPARTRASIRSRRRCSAQSLPRSTPRMRARRDCALLYDAGLAGLPLTLPARRPDAESCLPPICRALRPRATGCASAGRARHRHAHPLSRAGASPAGLSRARRDRARRLGESERAASR